MMSMQHTTLGLLYLALLTNNFCGITVSRHVYNTFKVGQRVKVGLNFEEGTATSYFHCANKCARRKNCMTASFNTDGSCLLSEYRVILAQELSRLSYGSMWSTYSKRGRYDDCRMIGDQCFANVQQAKNYSEAEAHCAENYGRLAEPQNSTMDSLLRNYLRDRYAPAFYWFGLTDRAVEGQFVWNSDGLAPGYTAWRSDEPGNSGSGRCVAYSELTDRKWDNTYCSLEYYFTCDILD